MYKKKSILGLIPARGGSKGVPGKNIRPLAGRPLIAWTIEAAKQSQYIDRLILSSDDQEIISVAESFGCEVPFVRPAELATDDAPGIAPVLHAVNAVEEKYDYLVLLQPTSPFRLADDIDGAIRLCIQNGADSCVSVTEAQKHPLWMYHLGKSGQLLPILKDAGEAVQRQQLQSAYALNGAVYVVHIDTLLEQERLLDPGNTLAYSMPPERSVDIDTPFDFKLCEWIAKEMVEDVDVF